MDIDGALLLCPKECVLNNKIYIYVFQKMNYGFT